MTAQNKGYDNFISGGRSYEDIIDFLCEEPEAMKDKIRKYDEDLQKTDLEIKASIGLRDIERVFGLPQVLEEYLEEEKAKKLESGDFYQPQENEINLMLGNDLDEIQTKCKDPMVDLFKKQGVKLDSENIRINLEFNEDYVETVELDSDYENISFHLPSNEGVLRKIHSDVIEYERLREEIREQQNTSYNL